MKHDRRATMNGIVERTVTVNRRGLLGSWRREVPISSLRIGDVVYVRAPGRRSLVRARVVRGLGNTILFRLEPRERR